MVATQIVVFSLLEFVIAIIAALVAAIAWRYRSARAGKPLVIMAVGTSLYAASTGLVSLVIDPFWWRIVNNIGYPLGAAIAVGSFFVVVEFTEQQRLQDRRIQTALIGFVAFDFLIAMTDPVHNQLITSQQLVRGVLVGTAGPLFWVHTISSLGIVFVATGLCLSTFLNATGVYRKQAQLVLGAFGVGIAGFIWQSIAPIHPALDLATVGMLGWCGIILWGIFVADFLDIVPVGRYRVVENIDDPVMTIDASDRVIDTNPALRSLIDAPADWHGTSIMALFDGYAPLIERITSRASGRVTVADDKQDRHFDVTISPIDDSDPSNETKVGSPDAHIVILRDETAEVNRQRQLKESRRRYQSLFENNPLVLWEEDLSEAIQRAEEIAAQTEDLVGYLESHPEEHQQLLASIEISDVNENAVEAYDADSKRELIERLDELFTEESLATNRELLKQLLDGERRFRAETTYRTLNGELREELLDVFVPDAAAADCSRVLVAATEITEQKERERELRYQTALFEAMNESTNAGVLVTSLDREILWHNSRFCELWDIPAETLDDSGREAMIRHLTEMVEKPEPFCEAIERVYEPPYEPQHTEFRLVDGRWVSRYTAPIVGEDGTQYGLLTLTRDITDRKQYETRIERQNQWLERLAKVISHDLRTPLSTADKHLQLLDLELDDPPDSVAESLADLERTHERLQQFTEHLPQLARESTDVQASVECDLATTAQEAWEVVETSSLELVIDGTTELTADPQRLQQVFENLFENVVQHAVDSDPGASTVWVGSTEAGFYVADDGPGVAPTQGEEIFEYGMSTADGSGVGLAIVRNIIEAHGWSISVADREGGGTRFTIETNTEYATNLGEE